MREQGRLGGSGHDLTVCGFGLRVGLCADSSEPGACFGFCVCVCVSLSLLSLSLSLFLPLSKINIQERKTC